MFSWRSECLVGVCCQASWALVVLVLQTSSCSDLKLRSTCMQCFVDPTREGDLTRHSVIWNHRVPSWSSQYRACACPAGVASTVSWTSWLNSAKIQRKQRITSSDLRKAGAFLFGVVISSLSGCGCSSKAFNKINKTKKNQLKGVFKVSSQVRPCSPVESVELLVYCC